MMVQTEVRNTLQWVEVMCDVRGEAGQQPYAYSLPERWVGRVPIGAGVLVPFGGRSVLGVVTKILDKAPAYPEAQVKAVEAVLDQPLLNDSLIAVVNLLQNETLCSPAEAVHTVLPAVARSRLRTLVQLTGDPSTLRSPSHKQVSALIQEAGGSMTMNALKEKVAYAILKNALSALRQKGLIRTFVELLPLPASPRSPALIRLVASPERLEAFFRIEGKHRPSQSALLTRLALHPEGAMPAQSLLEETGASANTLRLLESTGLVRRESERDTALQSLPEEKTKPPSLMPAQQKALLSLRDVLRSGTFQKCLLFGVTGSGKTEVYLRAAAGCLRMGRNVLFLVPEIALTAQLTGAFRARFGKSVAVLHSQLSESERLDQWLRVRAGQRSVVIGARSAVFAPLQNVGLIILDEEHEGAYKQQSTPRYHTRSIAEARARHSNAVLLLGSATPSLESFYEAQQGNMRLLEMPERASHVSMPAVEIVDLRYETGSILSKPMNEAIRQTLNADKQVILFLNRRAFSPFLICRECGHVPHCMNCSVSLAYHIAPKELRCHHCNHRMAAPSHCPNCSGGRLAPFGAGTQRVEQNLRERLPGVPVARLDRDVLTRRDQYLDILRAFRAGEIRILVGTQMIAKGLDFPNVQLVGVINADTALYLPDFRAGERTFQLLTQVAGRAGRREEQGRVLVQTYNPHHPALQCAQKHDYRAFYEWELAQRKELGYPPFSRLVNIVAQHANPDLPQKALQKLKEVLEQHSDYQQEKETFRILGPAPTPLARLQGEFRYHLLLRIPNELEPASLLRECLASLSLAERALLQVDIDAVNLL
jgi:primosomal protein N' (replication factor Y)